MLHDCQRRVFLFKLLPILRKNGNIGVTFKISRGIPFNTGLAGGCSHHYELLDEVKDVDSLTVAEP